MLPEYPSEDTQQYSGIRGFMTSSALMAGTEGMTTDRNPLKGGSWQSNGQRQEEAQAEYIQGLHDCCLRPEVSWLA